MAGRPFGSYDIPPIRSEANVDPFTNFVNNGMRPGGPPTTMGAPNAFAGLATAPSAAANAGLATAPSGAGATAGLGTAPSGIMPLLHLLAPIIQQRLRGGQGAPGGAAHPQFASGGGFSQPSNPNNNQIVPAAISPATSAGGSSPVNLGTLGGGQIMPLLQTIMSMFGNLG